MKEKKHIVELTEEQISYLAFLINNDGGKCAEDPKMVVPLLEMLESLL